MNKDTISWKDNLGSILASKGIFRLGFVNDWLYRSCSEWIDYLREFNHVNPEISRSDPEDHESDDYSGVRWISLSVNTFGLIPFKAYLKLMPDPESGLLVLRIKWTERVSLFNSRGELQTKGDKKYEWQEEKLVEPEIFITEYVLQLLNMRFKRFIENS